MKTFVASLLACLSFHCYAAQGPADGLYLAASGPPAFEMRTQDGRTVFLGARKELPAQISRFNSTNNDNTDFELSIAIPREESLLPGSYVLVVSGTAYPIGSGGCCNNNMASLNVEVAGDANAREVARYFNASIHYLKHPGHRLQVSMIPAQQVFTRGEDVNVTLRITNIGDAPVTIQVGGRDSRGGKNEFFFTAYRSWKPVPEISDRMLCADCLSSWTTIAPGATFTDTANLARWFRFTEAGPYDIQGSYKLIFPDASEKFTLYPWTEFVGAEFTVRMK